MHHGLKVSCLLLSLVFLLSSCGWLVDEKTPAVSSFFSENMLRISAAGQTFMAGSNDRLAASDEKPVRISFTYDFAISRTEISQKLFTSLMGFNLTPLQLQNSEFPVVQVSWYDAILFCNKLSKKENLDTVYTYTAIRHGPDGRVLLLENVSYNLGVDGYRLPTEAEWEFAALALSNQPFAFDTNFSEQFAWFSENSHGKLHKIASLEPNAFGLYDMAGNVMEWVHDHKGTRPDEDLTDYAGANFPDANNSRPVKGGSFRHHLRFLRPATRSEVYATTSFTRTDYIGFRVARGPILHPNYSTIGGAISQNPFRLTVQSRMLLEKFGTSHIKTAFVDPVQPAIVLVNFSFTPFQVRIITDTINWQHPMISPDGNWVAVSSRTDGQRGPAKSKVFSWDNPNIAVNIDLPSAALPRWAVLEDSGDTLLLVVSSPATNGDSLSWLLETTYGIPWKNGQPGIPSPMAQGTFHGGLSADGQLLATGNTQLRVLNNQSDSLFTGFMHPYNGKSPTGTTQICNLSQSPSGNLLYIDFGYSQISSLVGRSYGIHEFLFVQTRGMPSPARAIPPPAGWRGWDHPEWTTTEPWAIATAFDDSEESRSLWLVNTLDSSTLQLGSGGVFSQPHTWMQKPELFYQYSIDSLGWYSFPVFNLASNNFHIRLVEFWRSKHQFRSIAIGTSRVNNGISARLLPSYAMFNFGIPALTVHGKSTIVHNYILTHMPQLSHLIFSIDMDFLAFPNTWFHDHIGKNHGYIYDSTNHFWKNGIDAAFLRALNIAPIPEHHHIHLPSGDFLGSNGTGWGTLEFDDILWRDSLTARETWLSSFRVLEKLVDTLSRKGVVSVGIIFPQHPELAQSPVFARYGPPHAVAKEIQDSLAMLNARYDNFHILDLHQNGAHDFVGIEADNTDHLAPPGARKSTLRLKALLDSLRIANSSPP